MDYIWTTNLKMHPLHLLDLIYFCAEEIREGEIKNGNDCLNYRFCLHTY